MHFSGQSSSVVTSVLIAFLRHCLVTYAGYAQNKNLDYLAVQEQFSGSSERIGCDSNCLDDLLRQKFVAKYVLILKIQSS